MFLRLRAGLQRVVPPRRATQTAPLPRWLVAELRSDHAGETGAIEIYRGILAVTGEANVRAFAAAHLATEREHLALIESVLPARSRSLFLPFWRLAGFTIGAAPALFGPSAVYATIDAVESFVEGHYLRQIDRLADDGCHEEIRGLLARCRQDELLHRDEARAAGPAASGPGARGLVARAWFWIVGAGSAAAVVLARLL